MYLSESLAALYFCSAFIAVWHGTSTTGARKCSLSPSQTF